MDIKFMPEGFDDFKYLLVATHEITNFILAIPIKTKAAQVLGEAFIHIVIYIFGSPKLLMVDKDSAYTGDVINTKLK